MSPNGQRHSQPPTVGICKTSSSALATRREMREHAHRLGRGHAGAGPGQVQVLSTASSHLLLPRSAWLVSEEPVVSRAGRGGERSTRPETAWWGCVVGVKRPQDTDSRSRPQRPNLSSSHAPEAEIASAIRHPTAAYRSNASLRQPSWLQQYMHLFHMLRMRLSPPSHHASLPIRGTTRHEA